MMSFLSCSDDNATDEIDKVDFISIDPQYKQFPATAGDLSVIVKSSGNVKVTIHEEWIQQNDNAPYSFHVASNDKSEKRKGRVVFAVKKNPMVSDTLVIEQLPKAICTFLEDTVFTDYTEKIIPLALKTDADFVMEKPKEYWLHEIETKSVRTDTLHLHVDENISDTRYSIVRVWDADHTVTDSIVVCQTMKPKQESPLAEYDVIYHQKSTIGKGIKIAFVGDGFTENQESYNEYILEGIKAFFSIEPYRSYRDYFEVLGLCVKSKEQGISTPNHSIDTAFGITIPEPRVTTEMLFDADKASSFISSKKELDDIVLFTIISNTDIYAGTTQINSEGYSVAMCTRHDMPNVLRHESGGHGFGWLADEYVYDNVDTITKEHAEQLLFYQSVGFFLNVTLESDLENAYWSHLKECPKYQNIVGMFEGGYYYPHGVWRSESISVMDDNRPYFNTISREIIVRRIMELSGQEFKFEEFLAKDKVELASGRSQIQTPEMKLYPPKIKTTK